MKNLLLTSSLVLLAAVGCAKSTPTDTGPQIRGIEASPARLAFLCVTPGCDDNQTVHISVLGDRRVAIKRILLVGDGATDFDITPSEPAPFIIGGNSGFDVAVHYAPKGAPPPGAVSLNITYTDASPIESEDRLAPGELVVPLVRRIVGEPLLTAKPDKLSFGVVKPGESASLNFHVANDGFGNMTLEIASMDAGTGDFHVEVPAVHAFASGEGADVPVTFSPLSEGYMRQDLMITATAPEIVPAMVHLEGTSLATPKLGIEPVGDVDFGEVPRHNQRTVTVSLVNQGGVDLNVSNITVTDALGDLSATTLTGDTAFKITPLERVPLTIKLDGQTPGELDGTIAIASDDPVTPVLNLKVYGTVTEPKVELTPATLDYGTVPVGWVITKSVEIKNVGWGTLTVKNITMVSGSSQLYTLQNLPTLPLQLKRDQRIALDVQFRAETAATFNGWLSVESDDPQNSFAEVPITATAGTCDASCPIANGTPSCTTGSCEVGSCDTGYFNTDKNPATGCECKEVGTDPGGFCQDAYYAGNLKDTSHTSATFTGIVPEDGDEDLIRFYAEDGFQLFSDSFHVRIRLDSADPTIKMCVYRHGAGSHDNDCYYTEETCPQNRSYDKNSGGAGDDGADFVIKVSRTPGAANTCTAYTVFMSNG